MAGAFGQQLGKHESGAEDNCGVYVVPAGVRGAGHSRPVGHRLDVLDGERVDVRAEHDERRLDQTDVAHDAGAATEAERGESRQPQPGKDGLGRLVLGPGRLGVGVQSTPKVDEPGQEVRYRIRWVMHPGILADGS